MLLNRESLRYCNYRGDFCIYSAVGLFQMNKLIAAILVSLLSFPSFSKGKEDWQPYDLKKHEFALSGAVFPGRYAFGYDFDFIPRLYSPTYYPSVSGLYDNAATYNKERSTNTWTFSYTYNFTRIFSLQASLSYEGGWDEYYSRADDSLVGMTECHYLTPMLTARFSWLNRNLVRIYSSVGAGIAVSLTDEYYTVSDDGVSTHPETYISLQVTPVGISVGRKLFGFFELGVGTIYVGGCFGIGYRF